MMRSGESVAGCVHPEMLGETSQAWSRRPGREAMELLSACLFDTILKLL